MRAPALVLHAVAVTLLVPFPVAGSSPGDASAVLARAREAYRERADAARSAAAVELFKAAAKADPSSYDAHWMGARAAYYHGTYTRPDAPDGELLPLFQDGIDLARGAVALKPDGAEGHFWLGVVHGRYGETRGIMKSLKLIPDIRGALETSLELDPTVDGHGPDRGIGRMYFRLPWFMGGSKAKSVEYLERSLAGTPDHPLTRLYLADSYRATGRRDEAVSQLKELLAMTPDPEWAPEYPKIVEDAEKLLNKLE